MGQELLDAGNNAASFSSYHNVVKMYEESKGNGAILLQNATSYDQVIYSLEPSSVLHYAEDVLREVLHRRISNDFNHLI